MSLIRLILLFILIYVVFKVVKLFMLNFRLGAGSKPKSKYDDVEEAKFTEIDSKEKKPHK